VTQPLQGRRIRVTAGATGIGAAPVEVLSEAGADVVVTYHRTPPPDGAGVSWVQCDLVTLRLSTRRWAARPKPVAGSTSAAGLCRPGIPGQITGEDIDFLVDTNIKATILTNQAAYAVMRNNGGGRIINFDPLGGALGDPVNDLGPTLVFLCGEGSRFITGQLIAVDGGLVMLGA